MASVSRPAVPNDARRPPLHGEMLERMRASGLRLTRAREAVATAFVDAESPLGLQEIEERLAASGIPRSTVYRVVGELTDLGLLHRYDFDEGFARYEVSEEVRGHHHHFVCRSCKRVLEVSGLEELERYLSRAEAKLESAEGILVEGHRLDIHGICASCARSRAAKR